MLGALLYLLIPCHLFVAHLIELTAARQALDSIGRRKKDLPEGAAGGKRFGPGPKWTWRLISLAHTVNSTLCLGVTTTIVYANIHHPFIGTVCELHAVIVWLKICSYALSNRDMRRALRASVEDAKMPAMYSSCPYPRNISLGNLSYFWWAPTLVYQPVYPRSPSFRLGFFLKRVTEALVLGMFIWIASAQYAAPVLRNSLDKMQTLQWTSMAERLMKLSTISLVIWLAGFFAMFQSALNALAELIRFGDRSFYDDWWNSPSVGAYWRMWNKPVYYFMKRHVFVPLIARGWHPTIASATVFFFSAILHELLVGVPTHNIIGAFALPLPSRTTPPVEADWIPRGCLCRNDASASPCVGHASVGADAEHQRQDHRQRHLLDQLLSRGTAVGRPSLLLCLAGQVWQRQQARYFLTFMRTF